MGEIFMNEKDIFKPMQQKMISFINYKKAKLLKAIRHFHERFRLYGYKTWTFTYRGHR